MKNVQKNVTALFTSNVLAILLLMVGVLGSVNQRIASVQAQGQSDTCPEGDGWVKVDGLSGLTYEFEVPEGSVVTENCYKAGDVVVYGTGNVVTSEVFNSPGNLPEGEECTAPGVPVNGCNYQELSHASFKVEDPADPSPTPEVTPTPTPEVTPTPTPDPGDGGDGGDDKKDNGSGGTSAPAPQGQVLGTTYAATGVVEDVIMNVLGLSGAAFTTAGSVLYGKKKASVK